MKKFESNNTKQLLHVASRDIKIITSVRLKINSTIWLIKTRKFQVPKHYVFE